MAIRLVLSLILIFFPFIAFSEATLLQDEEIRAQQLFEQLKCSVCQAQTIKDSNSEIAKIMRLYVRESIKAGLKNSEILANLEQRYGKEVVLSPTYNNAYVKPLWLIPLCFLVLLLLYIKKRTR